MLIFINVLLSAGLASTPLPCPPAYTVVEDELTIGVDTWRVCEDVQAPGGALVLLSSAGDAEWFSNGYEPDTPAPDEAYYLGLGKQAVLSSASDKLGIRLLECAANSTAGSCDPTWASPSTED